MTAWEPQIAIRAIHPVVAALEALGHSAHTILADACIARAVLDDADARVPRRAMGMLWERALAATGDDCLGIHLAEAAPVGSFEVHAYAMLSSPTLREAYRRACRYQRLIHEVNDLTFDEGADEGVLRHAQPGGRPVSRHPAEFLATIWLRLGRMVTGNDWAPNLVCFAHPAPPDTSEHARVFGARVLFGSGRTAMHISNAVLDAPNQRGDPALARVLDRYAKGLLQRVPRRGTLSDRVRSWLLGAMDDGAVNAQDAARALNVSVRTLHRGLRGEGTTFRALVDQLRRERAATLLADPRRSIDEVAFLLGFAELSSFYRAFRRWTGKTPGEFRAEVMR